MFRVIGVVMFAFAFNWYSVNSEEQQPEAKERETEEAETEAAAFQADLAKFKEEVKGERVAVEAATAELRDERDALKRARVEYRTQLSQLLAETEAWNGDQAVRRLMCDRSGARAIVASDVPGDMRAIIASHTAYNSW